MVTKFSYLTILVFALILFACGQATTDSTKPASSSPSQGNGTPEGFEVSQTEKLLGVHLQTFPEPQGPAKFDELPPTQPILQFTVKEQAVSGPTPQPSFETRPTVKAKAPDGSVYEAYCSRDQSGVILGSQKPSTASYTRQMYGTHHGYGFDPQDVYIGKRVGNRIKTDLLFPDVGSHTTAPHHLAIDNKGMVHLIVADVNIFQNNGLDLYWVIGDPRTGKWTAAWLVDHRDFTSTCHPWSGASADKVNLLWHWEKQEVDDSPDEGIFHLQWQPGGFGKKVRVVKGVFRSWDAAVDPQSGRLLLVYSNDKGVYITSRPEGGTWTMPAMLNKSLTKSHDVSATSVNNGTFIIRTIHNYNDMREWVVRVFTQ
jgi:hypothetical protein